MLFTSASWMFALLLICASASEVRISQKSTERQQCNGMYSRKAWGGDTDPYISTTFTKINPDADGDPVVSLVIFEWKDEALVGVWPSEDATKKAFVCDPATVESKLCTSEQLGQYILDPKTPDMARNPVITKAIKLKDPELTKYEITHTGFYCVGTWGYSAGDYQAVVEFRNAYGELGAAQIAKLPFYGGLTVVYAVLAVFWGFLYVQNRHDILAVQNYITAMLIFLIIEQLMTWGFYDYSNIHGSNAGAKILMVIVAILNAGRNSFSFFLLLIVCMGYGVVKTTLGKTMWYVRALAGCHFGFGVIYAVVSLSITPDNISPFILLDILPLAASLTAFYVWTLNSLNQTMKDLLERKQSVKAMMYRRLWYCILGSLLVIFGFFFLNSFTFAGRNSPDFVPNHWKTRWFILDGWLNLVYLFDIGFVAYLWRPTVNNRRFAMSDELAQEDEDFEIASFGGSIDDEEDAHSTDGVPHPGNGALSPVPPKPINEHNQTRQSLDGETIFAVGDGDEGDRWSEDETSPRNSGERKKLTSK